MLLLGRKKRRQKDSQILVMKFAFCSDTAAVPRSWSAGAAGYDLAADLGEYECLEIQPHCAVDVHTGISMEIPKGYFGALYVRSGLASDKMLRPSNCVGVIDSDYRGEIIVSLFNDSDEPQSIWHHDRIAQIVLTPHLQVCLEEVDSLEETKRGSGGFGSTGR